MSKLTFPPFYCYIPLKPWLSSLSCTLELPGEFLLKSTQVGTAFVQLNYNLWEWKPWLWSNRLRVRITEDGEVQHSWESLRGEGVGRGSLGEASLSPMLYTLCPAPLNVALRSLDGNHLESVCLPACLPACPGWLTSPPSTTRAALSVVNAMKTQDLLCLQERK